METFLTGARKGARIGAMNMLPTLIAAFAIVQFLNVSHILDYIGYVLSPLMAPFGLPGEAITVLICAWMTCAGAIGMTAGMYLSGTLTPDNVATLLPAILLMGSQIQYLGRILGVANVKNNHIPILMGISILNAFLAMLMMKLFVL